MTQGFVGSKRPQPLGCSAGNEHQRRSPALADKPHHRRRYGPEVVEALVPPREASNRLCGKRLQERLPLLVESPERHGHLLSGSGCTGVAAGDEQCHDRPVAGPDVLAPICRRRSLSRAAATAGAARPGPPAPCGGGCRCAPMASGRLRRHEPADGGLG